jgi:hypothetical protein
LRYAVREVVETGRDVWFWLVWRGRPLLFASGVVAAAGAGFVLRDLVTGPDSDGTTARPCATVVNEVQTLWLAGAAGDGFDAAVAPLLAEVEAVCDPMVAAQVKALVASPRDGDGPGGGSPGGDPSGNTGQDRSDHPGLAPVDDSPPVSDPGGRPGDDGFPEAPPIDGAVTGDVVDPTPPADDSGGA